MSDLNVSDVLSEASDIYQQITQTSDQNDNIDNALELVEEVGDSAGGLVQEGFSSVNTKLLKIVLEDIVGVDLLTTYSVKLEDGMNPTQTKLVMESVKQVVRDFWQALKNSFNAIWAKLKSWYITVTSASESLVKKANKIKSRAETLSTTPTERKFEFKHPENIQIQRKVNSASLQAGLKTVNTVLEQTLNTRSTNEVENFIEAAEDALDNFIKNSSASNPDSSWANRFSDLYKPSVNVKTSPLSDVKIKEQIIYDDKNAEYDITDVMPGDTSIVYSKLKAESTLPLSEKLGLISARLVKTTQKEAESTVQADTLYPEQVSAICDLVVELNEQITFYEKAWQRRDKFMNKVLSSLDKSIEKIDNEEVEEGHDKVYKKTTRAILAAIKRSNTFNASLINYVVKVSAGSLSYCEASLTFYKQTT